MEAVTASGTQPCGEKGQCCPTDTRAWSKHGFSSWFNKQEKKKKPRNHACLFLSLQLVHTWLCILKIASLIFLFFLLLPEFPLGLFLSPTSFCSFLYLLYCDLLFSPTSLFISGHKMSSGTKKPNTKPFSVSASPISSFSHYSWFTHFQRLVHTETMFLT